MKRFILPSLAVSTLILTALSVPAQQTTQLPPHAPGTICITAQGWCWVDQGTVGSPCGCATSQGYIVGTHG